jgi:hypothetical protein
MARKAISAFHPEVFLAEAGGGRTINYRKGQSFSQGHHASNGGARSDMPVAV